DVIARPARREVPATIRNETPVSSAPMTSFVDAGDAHAGATVIAKGLMEYEIVTDGSDSPAIAITLIRAVGDLSRDDLATRPSGPAGPAGATPGAQGRGAHRFELASEPRTTPREPAELIASARAVTIPPRIVPARKPGHGSAAEHSFVRFERHGG